MIACIPVPTTDEIIDELLASCGRPDLQEPLRAFAAGLERGLAEHRVIRAAA